MPVLPIAIPENFKSSDAERGVLDRFLKSEFANDESKYVFHSVRAQEIGQKVVGEIDFIYFDEECILFLEVKGSKVYFTESTREWHVMGGSKKQDPWKQVGDYLFHFRDKILPKKFPEDFYNQKLVFGYGVMFPDCGKADSFTASYTKIKNNNSYEYELSLVYDAEDHANGPVGIKNYVSRIKKYWKSHGSNQRHNGINFDDLKKIKNYISKDIIFKEPISQVLKSDERSTNYLTIEQGRNLDFCLQNLNHSFVIHGGPGTGKTVLAFDLAVKFLKLDQSVLFVVYNQPLRDYLITERERLLRERKISQKQYDNFRIDSYNRLMTSLLKSWDPTFKTKKESEFWDQLPELFLEKSKARIDVKYDRLIIDECQDIANNLSFEVLGKFLKGGLNSNKFTLFLDDRFQVLYSKRYDSGFLNSFIDEKRTLNLHLSRNCRNSLNIVEEASINTGLPTVECLKRKVFEPELYYYNGSDDMMNRVKLIIRKIREAEVSNKLIGIITDTRANRDLILENIRDSSKLDSEFFQGYNYISVDTDKRYKGLDNELIIYVGSELLLDSQEYLCKLYVSITRAKGRIYMLFPSSCSADLDHFRNINGIKMLKKEL